jgi:hypothetical protein
LSAPVVAPLAAAVMPWPRIVASEPVVLVIAIMPSGGALLGAVGQLTSISRFGCALVGS